MLLGFMFGRLTFYHQGHEIAKDFKPYMTELQLKIQKYRNVDHVARIGNLVTTEKLNFCSDLRSARYIELFLMKMALHSFLDVSLLSKIRRHEQVQQESDDCGEFGGMF